MSLIKESIDINNIDLFQHRMIQHLTQYKINDAVEECKTTLLIYATKRNRFEIVKLLLTVYKADINRKYKRKTALSVACCYEYLDIMNYLFESYFDKYPKADFGKDTILTHKMNNEIIKFLLQKGAMIT